MADITVQEFLDALIAQLPARLAPMGRDLGTYFERLNRPLENLEAAAAQWEAETRALTGRAEPFTVPPPDEAASLDMLFAGVIGFIDARNAEVPAGSVVAHLPVKTRFYQALVDASMAGADVTRKLGSLEAA